jgi:SRSO17 transposase
VSALYYSQTVSVPVAFELVKKPDFVPDKKTGKPKRAARKTKNELSRQMLAACVKNGLPFGYVLNDAWFASAENRVYGKQALGKAFVLPLTDNRKVTFDVPEAANRHYQPVSSLALEADTPVTVWREDVEFPLLLLKQVFTNADGSQGIVYRVTSDTTLSAEQITTLYQKRGKVEEYHKCLKSNLAFARSPTKTVRTPSNHLFACLVAFVKRERLRMQTHLNPFAMKAKLYQAALASALQQLQVLKANCSLA